MVGVSKIVSLVFGLGQLGTPHPKSAGFAGHHAHQATRAAGGNDAVAEILGAPSGCPGGEARVAPGLDRRKQCVGWL